MKYIFYALLCCLFLNACSKKIEVDNPESLTVSVDPAHLKNDTLYYKVGDTAKFFMSGNAGHILFYSGEIGRNYLYANRTVAQGIPQLVFTSNAQTGTQANTLQVLATNKLAKLDEEHIVAANWTNITSRATLSIGSGAVASGTINMADLITGTSDSLFIAFKYTGLTGTAQRTWTITNLTVNNVLPDGNIVPQVTLAADLNYWTKLKIGSSTANWVPTATQLQVVGGTATAPNNISWVVSKPIYVSRINPDVPVVVKPLAGEIPVYTIAGKTYSGYNYQYNTKGTYAATIVVYNNSIDEQKTVIKQFIIKVL
ncbi:protein of unknown function [Pedobacter sp. ok626]|uniref:DUF5017 domain-containing protein n=1 Tax=Pedobacter sp. ok626 TaxID=1761882 RepID=UPI00088D98F3|nr:DUF5017 domain-containing protein [Pedobacter sp. ok626]SDJ00904.1 protein of unknown function [Pedobacter sp. ok626]